MNYNLPLFRPPSEANSLIFQVTLGCSWNRCTFCEMYTSKKFQTRSFKDIKKDIIAVKELNPDKIFLADGDAMVLSTKKLIPILNLLRETFPNTKRISSYATPQNIINKSEKELLEITQAGLKMLYYGVESGDNVILEKINKGVSSNQIVEGITKAQEAGFQISTTNLLGIAGKKLSGQHAQNTAKVLSQANPKFISFLMVMFPMGDNRFRSAFKDDFEALTNMELIQELRDVLINLEVKDSIIRANHASNYLPIKARFPEDKEKTIELIDAVLKDPNSPLIREEFMRGL